MADEAEGRVSDTGKSGGFAIGAHGFEAQALAPGLYLVATPIGNLRDITLRALETLAAADLVLCEDTRHTAKLFAAYGLKTPRSPLHEHNERERIAGVLREIAAGKAVALVSDAGTPLLSDPGFPLVRAAREQGIAVFAVPGASALLAGLTVSGLPTDSFAFFGFLPPKTGARTNALIPLAGRPETLIFYESPRRLAGSLADMANVFGEGRNAAVALELTKRFERVAEGSLAALAARFAGEPQKGEAVILVAGAGPGGAVAGEDWQAALASALETEPLRAAVDAVSARFGLRRKEVYDAALALKAPTR